MRTVAAALSVEMTRIAAYVDLVTALFNLARLPLTRLDGRRALTAAVADTHTRARLLRLGDSLAFEGAFLTACALFEEAVRDMIEKCADQMAAKTMAYDDLPVKMKKAHLEGCGTILANLKQDKFSHLTDASVIADLASCYCSPLPPSYSLTAEALSIHTNNFRSGVLADTVGRLGIDRLWPKLAGEASLQTLFKTSSVATVETFAVASLNSIMLKRNGAIHRGAAFVPPTSKEVKDAAEFFAALVTALANVLDAYVASL